MSGDTPYQVMPDLGDDEYRALKRDIRNNGVEEPVHIDEDGNIIDGHHRVRICDELGIDEYPTKIHAGLSEREKRELSYKLNLQRRHLEQGQKREIAKQYLLEEWDGEEAEESIAGKLGVHRKTVNNAKSDLKDSGKFGNLAKFSKEQQRQQVRDYIDDNPDASNREVAKAVEADVSHATVGNWRNEWEQGERQDNGETPTFSTFSETGDEEDVEAARELVEKAQQDDGGVSAAVEMQAKEIERGEKSPTEAREEVQAAEEQFRREEQEQQERKRKREDRLRSFNQSTEAVEIRHAAFQNADLEPESVDHILTDPPYGEDALGVWADLSAFADRVLKPGGYCIAYSGKYHLPDVLEGLGEHLEYYWQTVLVHDGPGAKFFARRLRTGYKPVLVYAKPPVEKQEEFVSDVIHGGGREKGDHEWQQAESEAAELLERFTNINDRVCDPMAGSGTTAVAATRLNRRCLAIDRDPAAVDKIQERVGHE